MAFTPLTLNGGLPGLSYVKKTMSKQIATMVNQRQVKREVSYFKEKMPQIEKASELVKDPILLKVTLTSFGLQDDIGSKFYIQKILESNFLDEKSFANKLSNKKYKNLSSTFGFGAYDTPKSKISGFAEKLLENYERKLFEISVGEVDNNIRLALNAESELKDLAASDASEKAKWYSVLASTPLRKVFEARFNLGTQFGAIDIDRQVGSLKKYVKSAFGEDTISQFSDSSKIDKLVKSFMIRSSMSDTAANGYSAAHVALNILRGGNS